MSLDYNYILLRIETPGFLISNENLSLEMDESNQYIIIETEKKFDYDE